MQRIEKSIEVDVPVNTCYDQWTQFESFPSFMHGVVQVQQLGDKRLRWVAEIAGDRKEWNSEIIEQKPNEVISWRSTSGALNNGSVTFQPISANRCKATLIMTYEPEGAKEKIGDALGVFSARVSGDLQRFKEFIEGRKIATGSWRGEIRDGQVTQRDTSNSRGVTTRDRAFEAETVFRFPKRK